MREKKKGIILGLVALLVIICIVSSLVISIRMANTAGEQIADIEAKSEEILAVTAGQTWSYGATGGVQTFTVPATGTYTFNVTGAAGADGYHRYKLENGSWQEDNARGGYGTRMTGKVKLTQGTVLYLYVGAKGSGTTGGWNGGGNGAGEVRINNVTYEGTTYNDGDGQFGFSGGGGGASDIRLGGVGLENRILVAPGGAGAGCSFYINLRTSNREIAGGGGHTNTYMDYSRDNGQISGRGSDYVRCDNHYWENRSENLWMHRITYSGGGGGGYYGGETLLRTGSGELVKQITSPSATNLAGRCQDSYGYTGTPYYNANLVSDVSYITRNSSIYSDVVQTDGANGLNGSITITLEHEHAYTTISKIDATCTTTGVKTDQCTICGDQVTQVIPSTGTHSKEHYYTYGTNAGIQNGVRYEHCGECNEVLETAYRNIINARYQNEDGSWGEYSNVVDKYSVGGETISWSRPADREYNAASASFTSGNTAKEVNVSVERNSSKVTLTKTDSITGERLNGATFGLYEWDGSTYARKSTLKDNGDGTYTTEKIYYKNANLGKYRIREEAAPRYYTNENLTKDLLIAEPGYHEYNYNVTNEPNKVKVQAIKVDSETGERISGVTFTIYEWNKEKGAYEVYARDEALDFQTNRSYLSNWLYANRKNEGKFRIIETGTPNGYYGDFSNGNRKNNDITITQDIDEQTITIQNKEGKYNNKRVKGTINLSKIDTETNTNLSQGEATLNGAEYGLYAAEDINHKDTVTGKIYNRDQLVQSAKTVNGKLKFENVEIGRYYIKEIAPSEGYLLSNERYEINMNYEGENVEHLTRNVTVKEKVKKQAFNIKKVSSNSSTTEYKPLANAGFKIYLIKDLAGVKNGSIKSNNGTYNYRDFIGYDFSKEQTAIDYSKNTNGERIRELFSDREGNLTSPELAYGTYVVVESTVPEDMLQIDPFIVTIKEDSRTPQSQRVVVDAEFESLIKVIKKDKQTGQAVLNKNAQYRIWSITENKYMEYTVSYPTVVKYGTEENPYRTNEKGEFITPIKLQLGEYELREVKAPEGYILTGHEGKMQEGTYTEQPREAVRFRISTNTVYYEDPETKEVIINVEQYNDEMLGELEITKTGEVLVGAKTKEDGTIEPIYEEKEIEGAEFEIYAKEDIYTIDNQGTKLCGKDQLVKKIATNNRGKAYIDNLPIGKYYIKEVKAGEGFILNNEQKEFEIAYGGEEKAVQKVEISYKNERQKIELNGEKEQEKEPEEIDPNKNLVIIKQAAKENYQIGETVQYIIKVINNGKQDITNILIQEHMSEGRFINLEESNKNGVEIANEGQKVGINKIEPGETVTLRYECVITKDTKVDLEENGKMILGNRITGKGKIEIPDPKDPEKTIEKEVEDESTEEIEIKGKDEDKLGIIKKDLETGEVLEGAVIGLYALEDIKGKDETIIIPKDTLIEKVTTNEKGKAKYTVDLPLGKYYIKEIEAPAGYKLSEEIIEIDGNYKGQETGEISISKILLNRSTGIKIKKKDTNGNLLEGAKLQVVTEGGKIVDSWETSKKVHISRNLEPGKTYILKEEEPAKGYVTADEIKFRIDEKDDIYYFKEENEEGMSVKEYNKVDYLEMVDEKTKIKIEIVDSETGEPIPGITIKVVDPETGEVIYEDKTDEEPKIIEGLPIGDYEIITEDEENRGYVTTEKDLKVEDTKEEQKVKIEQDYTKVEITLVDEDTKEPVEGKIQIIDKDGKVVQELETKDGKIEIEKLPIGEYTIHQTESQKGYFGTEDIKIKVEDTKEIQKFEILNKKKTVNYGIEKTLKSINLNGQNLEVTDNKLTKLEIKTSEIKKSELIARYNIKVSNKGEIEGKVKVIEKIPKGFELVGANDGVGAISNRPMDWQQNIDGTLETEVELEAGESKEIEIALRWDNKEENLGTKTNTAQIEANEEYEDINKEDDNSEATIVISIKTGEVVSFIIIIMIIIALIICGYIGYSVTKRKGPHINRIRFLNR